MCLAGNGIWLFTRRVSVHLHACICTFFVLIYTHTRCDSSRKIFCHWGDTRIEKDKREIEFDKRGWQLEALEGENWQSG